MTSCDTFVVLPSATTNQTMIFGKNSDRPKGEIQEIVFFGRQQSETGSKQKCTYIEVDSVSETNAIILSKPCWMWGAEMGANEHGLCIGNEAIWNKLINEKDSEPRLLGMDLVRLGLERANSARQALDLITNLLKQYGQGGPCSFEDKNFFYHNGFLLADSKEAWVLETVGNEWAAEKVDTPYRNISNCLSIETKIDLMSDQLKEVAKAKGFWDGTEPFNFSKTFVDESRDDRNRFEAGQKLMNDSTQDKNFNIKSMIKILRNRSSGICRPCSDSFPTTSSQVSMLSTDPSHHPSCHWFTGTPDPEFSYFKPFIFHPKVKTASEKTRSPIGGDDRRHILYKRHEEFFEKIKNDKELQQILRQIENLCIDELEQMLNNGYNETENEANEIDNLFSDSVESELRFYR